MREFSRYVALNVLGMLGISCYILADTFFVANALGSDGLAALNLAIPVYNFIHGAGLLLGIGGAARFALLRGFVVVLPLLVVLAHLGGVTGLWLAVPVTEVLVCAAACLLTGRGGRWYDRGRKDCEAP